VGNILDTVDFVQVKNANVHFSRRPTDAIRASYYYYSSGSRRHNQRLVSNHSIIGRFTTLPMLYQCFTRTWQERWSRTKPTGEVGSLPYHLAAWSRPVSDLAHRAGRSCERTKHCTAPCVIFDGTLGTRNRTRLRPYPVQPRFASRSEACI
jgi:hypothetical protein